MIDPATNRVTGTYPVGAGPTLMAFDPGDAQLYISSFSNGSLVPFNVTSDTVGLPIPVGAGPMGVLADGPGGLLYVVNYRSANLSVIDPTTDRPVGSVPLGSQPIAAALLPDGATYVTDTGGSSLSILSNASLRAVSVAPQNPTATPGGGVALRALSACAAGPCPTSVLYRWTLVRGAGALNTTRGSIVTFLAADRSGAVALSVQATLGPVVRGINFTVTVANSAPAPTILGLPTVGAYALFAGVGLGAAGILIGAFWARRGDRRPPRPPL